MLTALASNDAGVGLYKSAGFSRVGIYREQGQLDGKWVDVVIMEKICDGTISDFRVQIFRLIADLNALEESELNRQNPNSI